VSFYSKTSQGFDKMRQVHCFLSACRLLQRVESSLGHSRIHTADAISKGRERRSIVPHILLAKMMKQRLQDGFEIQGVVDLLLADVVPCRSVKPTV
jgi:hypothetical protein